MRNSIAMLLVALATSAASPVMAQDFPAIGSQYMDFGSSMMAVGQMNNVMGAAVRNNVTRTGSHIPAPTSRPTLTGYKPSPEISARVRRQFADFAAAQDPANAEQLRQTILQTDLIGAWERHVAVDGLRRDDVADAMTAYWVQNWQIANKMSFASKAQVQAVRRQLARAITDSPTYPGYDGAQKQELAEIFILNFVAQGSAFSDAIRRKDIPLTNRLSDAAAARFRKEMKVDLRRLKLTDAGFVPA